MRALIAVAGAVCGLCVSVLDGAAQPLDPQALQMARNLDRIALSKALSENPGANVRVGEAIGLIKNKAIMTFSPDRMTPTFVKTDASGKVIYSSPARPIKGHGTQIEYASADGKVYLWYPGNQVVLGGQWRVETRSMDIGDKSAPRPLDVTYTCFRYDTTGRNPMTGETGLDWSCNATLFYKKNITESANGDVFGLSRRRMPPFVLDRDRTSLDALRKRAGAS
jgi:hypothetical protein